MKKPDLTVIIPFLNEGKEIENTLDSIKATTTGAIRIVLINDCSTDGYDYESVARRYGCRYVVHQQRKGVAASRDEGIEIIETPYFLLLDGHMRFYEKGWDLHLVNLLAQNPRAILCGQTKKLGRTEEDEVIESTNNEVSYGAYIDILQEELFRAAWNYTDPHPHAWLVQIPCILGAAYAGHKSYWQKLKGLEGLIYYGTDEELVSLKVWNEGGKCLLVKDWVVGHIYREHFPYEVQNREVVYNRLYTIELFMPYAVKRELFSRFRLVYGDLFEEAYTLLGKNYAEIRRAKQYQQQIQGRSIDEFLVYNRQTKDANNKKTIEKIAI